MRVAVIGAGRMGHVQAAALASAEAVDEVVVADVDADRAKALAGELGALAASNPMDALESADAAVIATPPATHADLVRAAVDRGCPVLCEKPLTDSLAAATDLAEYVSAAGILVEVGFHRRFDHGYLAARSAVSEGRLGRLHLMRLQTTETGLPPSPKTNLLRNTAIHDFDLVRWLSGDEVVSVYAEGADRERRTFDPRFDPDTIVASLRLSGGAVAAVTVTRLSPGGYDVRAELVGSADHLAVGWTERTPVRTVEHSGARADQWTSWQERFAAAYRTEVTAFLTAVAGGVRSGATVRDAVAAQRIADAARRSLGQGCRISLER